MAIFARQKTEVNSLAKAYDELNKRLGRSVNSNKFQAFIDHSEYASQSLTIDQMIQAITTYDKHLALLDSGDYGSWPTSNNAIMKFQYQSNEQPFIEADGGQKANILDIYCIPGDFGERTIVSPIDGEVIAPNLYGLPLGWATFQVLNKPAKQEIDKDHLYVVPIGGESCWQIAIKVNQPNVTGLELADHNEIDDPARILEAGTNLRLPYKRSFDQEKPVRVELIPVPLDMHVSFPSGTKKQSFGLHKSWKDITPNGPTYPENTNLKIVAVAYVPIEDENIEAAYYLDQMSLGDYAETGILAQTIGFNHAHLSDGYAEQVIVKPKEEEKQKPVEQIEAPREEVIAPSANSWKKTTPLNTVRMSEKYTNPETLTVFDAEGRMRPRVFKPWTELLIFGTFPHPQSGELYYRDVRSVENGNWLAIPRDKVISEAEIHNYQDITLREKAAISPKSLTFTQRNFYLPVNVLLGRYTSLKINLGNKNKNNKEQK
jgi:hypothetical protein